MTLCHGCRFSFKPLFPFSLLPIKKRNPLSMLRFHILLILYKQKKAVSFKTARIHVNHFSLRKADCF